MTRHPDLRENHGGRASIRENLRLAQITYLWLAVTIQKPLLKSVYRPEWQVTKVKLQNLVNDCTKEFRNEITKCGGTRGQECPDPLSKNQRGQPMLRPPIISSKSF